MRNAIYTSPKITDVVMEDYVRKLSGTEPVTGSPLSPREREVLQLLAEGRSTKEIAGHLNVSVNTVDTHRRRIMDKLELRSVAELTKYAIREGLTSVDE
jgi:DNA-binding NarL/FixJ family response regulator